MTASSSALNQQFSTKISEMTVEAYTSIRFLLFYISYINYSYIPYGYVCIVPETRLIPVTDLHNWLLQSIDHLGNPVETSDSKNSTFATSPCVPLDKVEKRKLNVTATRRDTSTLRGYISGVRNWNTAQGDPTIRSKYLNTSRLVVRGPKLARKNFNWILEKHSGFIAELTNRNTNTTDGRFVEGTSLGGDTGSRIGLIVKPSNRHPGQAQQTIANDHTNNRNIDILLNAVASAIQFGRVHGQHTGSPIHSLAGIHFTDKHLCPTTHMTSLVSPVC
ncbi:uncharacterized protein BDR25DRAFT_317254 [Lindgomyces ingoldianus]|uniref:Uncharacterized protein n=1 Tax=Lindgomyces ingoldianus TaxID=673940 RepID=A0ACB6QJF3_9PLEO|nr:uncharacterized protein BDR25DRAFT_317254 [Lindgomyces ingoldianus]KAF2467025.1 hypothetical protein BDR25DRAFT_317254 [Lindgomyces ingoldianus]